MIEKTPRRESFVDRRGDLLWAFAIAFVTVCLVLSFRPFANVPRGDDFSYARTAEAFARTGRIVYNGWGSPMLIPQAVVGGLLIRLFGFSYNLLDGFGIFSAGTVAAASFLLGRRCRLSRSDALLATTAMVGTPMFLGCAPTFMTDLFTLLIVFAALIALFLSLRLTDEGTNLSLDRRWFAIYLLLTLVAGSNRQISWVACIAAAIPLLLAVRSRSDRLTVVGGMLLAISGAVILMVWMSHQNYIVPADIYSGMIQLIGYPELALPFIYKFIVISGIFTFPFVLVALRRSDLRQLSFWVAIVIGVGPLCWPTTKRFSCFNPLLGVLPSGQYFTNFGSRNVYLTGAIKLETSIFPPIVVDFLMIVGAFSLGASIYLILIGLGNLRSRAVDGSMGSSPNVIRYRWTLASALCFVSLSQIIVSIPWIVLANAFDRYFIFYTPGLALFFLSQSALRRDAATLSQPAKVVRGISVFWIAALAVTGYAFAGTAVHSSTAQSDVFHQLLARGIAPENIDDGFDFDADTQVALQGHVNYRFMVPKDLYNPDAKGKNLTSPIPDVFPIIDAHYILSLTPSPDLKFQVDTVPICQETFTRFIPPWKLTVYALRVLPTDAKPPAQVSPGVERAKEYSGETSEPGASPK